MALTAARSFAWPYVNILFVIVRPLTGELDQFVDPSVHYRHWQPVPEMWDGAESVPVMEGWSEEPTGGRADGRTAVLMTD